MRPEVNLSDLSVLAYANNFTLWHYRLDDSRDTALSNGYFDKAADMMRTGDMVFINCGMPDPAETTFIGVVRNVDGKIHISKMV